MRKLKPIQLPSGQYFGTIVELSIEPYEDDTRCAYARIALGVDGPCPIVLTVPPCPGRKRSLTRGAAGGENTTRAMRRASTRSSKRA